MYEISRILGIEGVTIWDFFKYPCVPIFKRKPKTLDWIPLIEKFKKKILAWGAVWLNLAMKLVMINYVLNSFPMYQCSIMVAPIGILSIIEGLL